MYFLHRRINTVLSTQCSWRKNVHCTLHNFAANIRLERAAARQTRHSCCGEVASVCDEFEYTDLKARSILTIKANSHETAQRLREDPITAGARKTHTVHAYLARRGGRTCLS